MSNTGIIYVERTINAMAISGLWKGYRFKSPIKNTIYKIYGNIIFAIFMCFNITQIIEMYSVLTDIFQVMQNMGVTLLYSVLLFKVSTIHFQTKRIRNLLAEIRHAESRAFQRTIEEVQLYTESIEYNWLTTKGFWILCLVTISAFFISRPVEYLILGPQEIHHNRIPFIFSSWFPFDKFAPGYYQFAYGYQFLSGTIGAYYIAVVDTFIITLMNFGIGQFRMIQCAIRNLHVSEKCVRDAGNELDLLDVYPQVVEIIKHHCRVIKYIEDLDSLINPIMLLNFLLCSLMICAVGLEGIMAGPSVRLALSIEYLISLLIEVFNYYWHANEISLESSNVANAVMESQWYRFTRRVKKALMMITIRSQKPSAISEGGFFLMSISTYLMILRATYSYLALFRKIYSYE